MTILNQGRSKAKHFCSFPKYLDKILKAHIFDFECFAQLRKTPDGRRWCKKAIIPTISI